MIIKGSIIRANHSGERYEVEKINKIKQGKSIVNEYHLYPVHTTSKPFSLSHPELLKYIKNRIFIIEHYGPIGRNTKAK
jgi:hypothetical protein